MSVFVWVPFSRLRHMAIITRFSATKNIIRKWFLQRTRTLSHSPSRPLVRIQMESKEEEKNEDGKQNKIAFLLLFDASTHFPTHSSHSSCAQLRYLFSNYIINLMICDRFLIGFLLLESIPIWRKIKCYICILSHAGAYKNTQGLSLNWGNGVARSGAAHVSASAISAP